MVARPSPETPLRAHQIVVERSGSSSRERWRWRLTLDERTVAESDRGFPGAQDAYEAAQRELREDVAAIG
ncbi:hypothetical protein [Muricoccus radiodurans]|uniref:hypothetical protein n=1 Tax=Muricoccus radiodurans TaxID=2231721 RepID=UPI003CFAFE69